MSRVRLQSRRAVFSGNLRDANTAECNKATKLKTRNKAVVLFIPPDFFSHYSLLLIISLSSSPFIRHAYNLEYSKHVTGSVDPNNTHNKMSSLWWYLVMQFCFYVTRFSNEDLHLCCHPLKWRSVEFCYI